MTSAAIIVLSSTMPAIAANSATPRWFRAGAVSRATKLAIAGFLPQGTLRPRASDVIVLVRTSPPIVARPVRVILTRRTRWRLASDRLVQAVVDNAGGVS